MFNGLQQLIDSTGVYHIYTSVTINGAIATE